MKWRNYITKFAILVVMSIAIMLIQDVANQETLKDLFTVLSDAFVIPAILYICFGILIFCTNGGAFYMLSYGVQTAFTVFKKDPKDRKYRTYYDYCEAKSQNQKPFWSFIISGLIYLVIGIVLFIIYLLV